MTYEAVLQLEPYQVDRVSKKEMFTKELLRMTEFHIENCPQYARMMRAIGFNPALADNYESIPFLPVRLFKELELCSVQKEDVYKIMTSSGTSGQQVSKIYLDKATAANQQKTLAKIFSNIAGGMRMPMIIVDCPSVLKNRNMFSARGAGILGFSIFARKKIYALNDDMELQIDAIQKFLEEYKGEKVLLFGFTFMVWQHFYKALKQSGRRLELGNAILIHGGGWKKMVLEAVTPEAFNSALRDLCGIPQVVNYYGMVEQTGCIYIECEEGHLHASTYSDVIIRRGGDFSVATDGERGIIQVVSLLPWSYPGHSLLTEDEGVLLGEDNCPCGRKGKYFKVLGRLKNAEIRGCSDTYATKF
ncbi:acyl-protein synthetase [Anaerovibrio sp.]|uniref:LuxE/PaaK family acyltransferase n=1 Tax=Anaerovibrio sp. TaxID=1872532 RepID=UPI0025BBE5F2|nr:acyl-protein synthetase [Anaerovibrio sp.]MBR2141985.1 acyl-protein synthetase [Anaerovibrio sp.]